MADPLGVAASILSLTDAVIIIGRFIRRIRNCPAELLAVNNELSDLRYVLTEVERLQENEEVPGGSNLGRMLERAQVVVQETSGIVQKLEGNDNNRFSVIDRVEWSVTQKEKVTSLISRLREIRFQLDTLIAADTAYVYYRIALEHSGPVS